MAFEKGNPGGPGRPKNSISYSNQIISSFMELMDKEIVVKEGRGKSTITTKSKYYTQFLNKLMDEAMNGNSKMMLFLGEKLLRDDVLSTVDKFVNQGKKEDLDFLGYRIYKECHNYQQKVLLDHSRKILLICGRRAGKSETLVRMAVQKAIQNSNSRILLLGMTFTRAMEVFYIPIVNLLNSLDIDIKSTSKTEGVIVLANETEIHFRGNSNSAEADKIRGSKWALICIDEGQSQRNLRDLVENILEPTLLDYANSQLVIAGTAPRIAGSYFEEIWSNEENYKGWSKYNWNISHNCFIPDYQNVLEKVKEEKGLTDTSPLFLREYLGIVGAYDLDSIVYRLNENNYYTNEELTNWINSQPISDIRFTGGLDFGFVDSDAFNIIMFSTTRPERFQVYEYKKNRTGVAELANAVKAGIEYIETNELFRNIPNKFFYIYADTSDKKISSDFISQYGLPILDAFKSDKNVGIEILQEEVRRGVFKVPKGSIFDQEALRTVFMRNEKDELTRIIDDTTFHPDLLDAVLYSLRFVWINYRTE